MRLDILLVEKGLADSKEKARALILEGMVYVNGVKVTKAGTPIDVTAAVKVLKKIPYVSRGGLKLEAALKNFNIELKGKTAMDIGASTGGFTDCLLQHGIKKVYAIDVGYGQIAWKIRNDPRVVLLEKTNIRHLDKNRIEPEIDLAVIDVSFISLLIVIPRVLEFLSSRGEIIALIKPQFEVDKDEVEKGGVVREEDKRLKVIGKIKTGAENMGLKVQGVIESPILGPKGNVEYFIHLKRHV